MSRLICIVALAIVFGLLYAYDLWEAVSNLIALPGFYESIGIGADRVPWWLLGFSVAAPVILFAGALALGRGRSMPARALLFFAGLAVSSGLSLTVIGLEQVLRPL